MIHDSVVESLVGCMVVSDNFGAWYLVAVHDLFDPVDLVAMYKYSWGFWLGAPLRSYKDTFVQECEIIRTELMESEVTVAGEYASKKTMAEKFKWSEPPG